MAKPAGNPGTDQRADKTRLAAEEVLHGDPQAAQYGEQEHNRENQTAGIPAVEDDLVPDPIIAHFWFETAGAA